MKPMNRTTSIAAVVVACIGPVRADPDCLPIPGTTTMVCAVPPPDPYPKPRKGPKGDRPMPWSERLPTKENPNNHVPCGAVAENPEKYPGSHCFDYGGSTK
jgi:hypothetical protein